MRRRKTSLIQFARPEGDWQDAKLPGLTNSVEARRFRRYAKELIKDGGGEERVTTLGRALRYRAAAIITILDQIEGRMLSGQPIDVVFYSLMVNTLVRISRLVGIERLPKEVESLESYLERLQQKRNDSNGAGEAEADEAIGEEANGEHDNP
jgi:hypothetical protein